MVKISSLYKSREDSADIAQLNLNYCINNLTFCYMSRSECLFLFFRYVLALITIIFLVTILFPDLIDEILDFSVSSFLAVLSLVLLLPCSYRLASQRLSPYLLIFHLLPFGFYFSHSLFKLSKLKDITRSKNS